MKNKPVLILDFFPADKPLQDSSLHIVCGQLPANSYWKGNLPNNKIISIAAGIYTALFMNAKTLYIKNNEKPTAICHKPERIGLFKVALSI